MGAQCTPRYLQDTACTRDPGQLILDSVSIATDPLALE